MNLPEEKDYESANKLIVRIDDVLDPRTGPNEIRQYILECDGLGNMTCKAWRQWDEYVHNLRFKHMVPKGHLGYTEADRKIDLDMKTASAVRIRDELGDKVQLLKQRIDLVRVASA